MHTAHEENPWVAVIFTGLAYAAIAFCLAVAIELI